jgi:hypothetical protein
MDADMATLGTKLRNRLDYRSVDPSSTRMKPHQQSPPAQHAPATLPGTATRFSPQPTHTPNQRPTARLGGPALIDGSQVAETRFAAPAWQQGCEMLLSLVISKRLFCDSFYLALNGVEVQLPTTRPRFAADTRGNSLKAGV